VMPRECHEQYQGSIVDSIKRILDSEDKNNMNLDEKKMRKIKVRNSFNWWML